ncbi:hypothetical protein [Paenibacillus alkalitolerans]|uniref:hypothetical protein n=1 Tax=Paenibacillus alkalitolerans TaxID=2799335 RepID=UPI0018F691F3|nr:hypothetical protein [Paenibacillus alkalitolerans]
MNNDNVLVSFLMSTVIIIAIFLLIRWFWLWYWKINIRVETLQNIEYQLTRIADKLCGSEDGEQYPNVDHNQ